MDYFDRDGKRLDLFEWATLCDDPPYSFVAYTTLTDPVSGDVVEVCTDWLGIDYSFGRAPVPYAFETQIFGGAYHLDVRRYPTADAALSGHNGAVVMAGLAMPRHPRVTRHPRPEPVSHADET